MEFTVLQIDQLREWDDNSEIRDITPENFDKLKIKLKDKPQYEPLFVTPNEDGTFTVIAGNHRLRAYRELGVAELWVRIVQVRPNEDSTFSRELDGELESERFQTYRDALMDFSLSHNERFAHYELGNMTGGAMDAYNLNWDNYNIDTFKPMNAGGLLKKFGMEHPEEASQDEEEKRERKPKMVICPECSKEFYV